MTGTTTTQALATVESGPTAVVQQYADDFAAALPSHIDTKMWLQLALGTLRKDENLRRVATNNPRSLVAALRTCASLGHVPGTRAFYLVPIGNSVEGWEGWRGVVDRMYRGGEVLSVKAQVVRANDAFTFFPNEMEKPDHKPDWFGDRGGIIGAYSYALFRNGLVSQVPILNRAYLDKVRKESRGSDKSTSPWVKWEEAMTLKTAVHRLEAWVPTSVEFRSPEAAALALNHPAMVGTTVHAHDEPNASPDDEVAEPEPFCEVCSSVLDGEFCPKCDDR